MATLNNLRHELKKQINNGDNNRIESSIRDIKNYISSNMQDFFAIKTNGVYVYSIKGSIKVEKFDLDLDIDNINSILLKIFIDNYNVIDQLIQINEDSEYVNIYG